MDKKVILDTMIVLFSILILGYILNKVKLIDSTTNKKFSSLIVKVTCPALVIYSVSAIKVSGEKSQVIYCFIIGVALYCILPFLAIAITKILRIEPSKMGTCQFMIIFANTSFMGFPIVQSIYGDEAIFYNSILHMGFNVLAFSYGIYLISKDGEIASKFEAKNLINPGIISSILALIIYFMNLRLPDVVVSTLGSVGNITTPLSMIVLGASIAEIPLGDIFKEKKVYLLTIIRLIILPIIAFYILNLITDNNMIIGVGTITIGMPVASMAVMLANEYNGQTKLASIGVLITTVCSIISIPLITYFLLS